MYIYLTQKKAKDRKAEQQWVEQRLTSRKMIKLIQNISITTLHVNESNTLNKEQRLLDYIEK